MARKMPTKPKPTVENRPMLPVNKRPPIPTQGPKQVQKKKVERPYAPSRSLLQRQDTV